MFVDTRDAYDYEKMFVSFQKNLEFKKSSWIWENSLGNQKMCADANKYLWFWNNVCVFKKCLRIQKIVTIFKNCSGNRNLFTDTKNVCIFKKYLWISEICFSKNVHDFRKAVPGIKNCSQIQKCLWLWKKIPEFEKLFTNINNIHDFGKTI